MVCPIFQNKKSLSYWLCYCTNKKYYKRLRLDALLHIDSDKVVHRAQNYFEENLFCRWDCGMCIVQGRQRQWYQSLNYTQHCDSPEPFLLNSNLRKRSHSQSGSDSTGLKNRGKDDLIAYCHLKRLNLSFPSSHLSTACSVINGNNKAGAWHCFLWCRPLSEGPMLTSHCNGLWINAAIRRRHLGAFCAITLEAAANGAVAGKRPCRRVGRELFWQLTTLLAANEYLDWDF